MTKFYDRLSEELDNLNNSIQEKLDSVANERQAAIALLEKLINQNLKPENN
jgi:hypothetical protein